MTVISRPTAAAELLWFGNTLVSIVVPSASSVDRLCVMEHWMPAGDSPPLHLHRNEDEVFHILSGALRFRIEAVERTAYAGETLLAPKGVPHSYLVESAEGAHCLTVTRGTDFESMVRAASRPAASVDLPSAIVPTAETIAELASLCAANGIDIVGSPLGRRVG